MTRGSKKRISPVTAVLLALALLASLVGGAAAYLSYARGLANSFQVEVHPQVTMAANTVTIPDPGYAVFVRAAVVVNWKNGNNIVATMPIEGTDYSVYMGDNWKKVGEYYYYSSMVDFAHDEDFTVTPTIEQLSQLSSYQLSVTLAVQTIQALGTTDAETQEYPDGMPAVTAAWGIPVLTEGEHKGDLDLSSS